jgi:mono/diheme cytochrome c family protein
MKKLITLTVMLSASLLFANSVWSSAAAGESKPAGGAALYNQHCVKCHGAGGKGVENFTPDLAKATNKGQWLEIINNGKDTMPGFKDSLKPVQVQSVLTYIKSFGRGGKKK